MVTLSDRDELLAISGGLNVTGTIINAFSSGIKTILEIGRSLGTAIRRISLGNLCSIS